MADDESRFGLDKLQDHERPLGALGADSLSAPYVPCKSLKDAQAVPDGVVILQGDDGGQIYVVCPASQVACTAEALADLLQDLDGLAWNNPEMAHIYYERRPIGSGIAGGMGGAFVASGPWVHAAFVELQLKDRIVDVLQGRRARIR